MNSGCNRLRPEMGSQVQLLKDLNAHKNWFEMEIRRRVGITFAWAFVVYFCFFKGGWCGQLLEYWRTK